LTGTTNVGVAKRPGSAAWALLVLPAALALLGGASRAGAQNEAAARKPAPAAPAAPAAAKPMPAPVFPPRPRTPVRVATLSNGLHLLCRPNNASEIVSIVCMVRAGLPDEREEQAGLAALTAETLLRGTTNHLGANFNTALARAGGNLKTTPGFDFTEVSAVTSREQFEAALKLVGDVVSRPRLAPEDVNEAREALKRRAETVNQDFTGASYQTLTTLLYPRTPYGRAIDGYPQALDRLTAGDVQRFWKENYVQNRMWVAIVGDVDAEKAIALAQKAFADVPHRQNAVTATPGSEALGRARVEMIQRSGPAAQIMAGFLAPPTTRANYPVYALLDSIVGGGKRARLFANIREKRNMGYELGSFYQPLLFRSHMIAYVVTPQYRKNPRTEQPESVLELVKQALLEQFSNLAVSGPTDQEMARAKAYVVGRYALRQERSRDQAKWLAWNEAMGLGRDFDEVFPSLVQAVTKEQIQQAAKSSLSNYALVMTVPSSN